MLDEKEFARPDPLSLEGFSGSGADWLERYKLFINDGKTIVASPHKAWGPQTNDLVFQLRKHGVSKIVLAGMLANLCVESHLRELHSSRVLRLRYGGQRRDRWPATPEVGRRLCGGAHQLWVYRQCSSDNRRGREGYAVNALAIAGPSEL